MVFNMKDLKKGLVKVKLNKKNMQLVQDIIQNQLFLFKHLKLDPSKVSLIIVGKKIEGVDVIRVFDKKNVLIEVLDTSYTRLRNLSSLEDWNTNFILWVSFLENGNYVDIIECKLSDIVNVECKKVKSTIYGVTDGEDVVSINISQHDIKGAEYDVIKACVAHTFNKRTGKDKQDLMCMAVGYC